MGTGNPAGRPRREDTESISIKNDYTRPDPLKVGEGKDGMRRRWIRNTPDNIERQKAGGWNIITGGAPEKVAINQSADGTRRYGDLILAEMPEDKARAREAFFRNQGQRQVESTRHTKGTVKNASFEGETR
jgi:hypothetical protein